MSSLKLPYAFFKGGFLGIFKVHENPFYKTTTLKEKNLANSSVLSYKIFIKKLQRILFLLSNLVSGMFLSRDIASLATMLIPKIIEFISKKKKTF